MREFRLVHIGVAAALAAAGATAAQTFDMARATGAATPAVFVPIVPCRLADTRPGTNHVGTLAGPLIAGGIATFAVWGTNGDCTIPTAATGIATNVTIDNPTGSSYLTVYPADADPRPTASNLNWTATSSPTPNQVTVGLSATGTINAYNNNGTVDVIIDIVGYYQAAGAGSAGPPGPPGAAGTPGGTGLTGPPGAVGPSGVVNTFVVSGFISGPIVLTTSPTILGGTALITTTAAQKVTGVVTASIGNSGVLVDIGIDLCYQQASPPGPAQYFQPLAFPFVRVPPATRFPVTAASTTVPGAGTWRVGMCAAATSGSATLNANDWTGGWVIVTN